MDMQPEMHSMQPPQLPGNGDEVHHVHSTEQQAHEAPDAQKHMDQTMDVDESNNTTITASTIGLLPDFAQQNQYQSQPQFQQQPHYPQGNYQPQTQPQQTQQPFQQPLQQLPQQPPKHPIQQQQPQQQQQQQQPHQPQQSSNGYAQEPYRPSTSYSDTGYQYSGQNGSRFNTPSDADTPPRPTYYDSGKETHMGQSHSRPNSQMGRYPGSDSGSRSNSYQDQARQGAQQQQEATKNASVVIKVGMVGDAQIGKTSLMVKYVEGSWDEDYIQTLGVNFMEKTISIRNTEITFSIWDLGGQREFVNMLPLVCNDAVAILFMFDLTRKSTLNSIKEWYRQGRGFNKTAIPFLVGTKYDHFVNFPREEQEEISNQAKRFARAMKASLIFSSTSHSINVQKIFKIVLSKAFDLKCTIPEIENIGEPLLLYQAV